MSRARSAPPELPGFTLVEGIGSGGFADVFLFTQHHPSRPVAVKVLRAEYVSESSLRQFANEANVMAQVSEHPYIVTIHTSGIAPDGRPFIVMEHYPGEHFGIRARGGRLAVAEVLRVGVQVASAVETAHRAGILHRDIKPANILTSSYGRPGLTDFGIASVASEGGVTAADGVTVAFSSPEVLLDPQHNGSEASDLYSLSATLFSLLTGHSPFWVPGSDNTDQAVIGRVVSSAVPQLQRPDAPASLVHLLANGMASDPAHRPPSAVAFARALQSIEQQLSLAPTAIEVRDEYPVPAAPVRDDLDEEGTRRASPQVVNPYPAASAPAPTPTRDAVAAPPVQPRVPAPPAVAAPPPAVAPLVPGAVPADAPLPVDASPWAPGAPLPRAAPVAPSSGFDEDPETIMKRPAPPAAPKTSVADRLRGRDGGPNLALIGGVAAVVLLVVSVAVVLLTRGDDPGPPSTAPTTTSPTVVVAERPEVPSEIAGSLDAAGTLTVTFLPDSSIAGPKFRLVRVRGEWPGAVPWIDSTEPTVTVPGLAPGERVCFTVSTIANSAISDPSDEVCATLAPPPTEPPPSEPPPSEPTPEAVPDATEPAPETEAVP